MTPYPRRLFSFLSFLGLAAQLALSIGWFRGMREIRALRDFEPGPLPGGYPSLSVVVPARDEERAVAGALRSVLENGYPGRLEVFAVDDRSTDATPGILASLAGEYPNLTVLSVRSLPEGWLGKNHALYVGASEAGGEWLLFSDADVHLAPGCLARAVACATRDGLDHLTLSPDVLSRGTLLSAFVATFYLIFTLVARPWLAKDPRRKESVGVGAFNLVRRDAYLAAGTHRAIALRPDDDMKLAKLLKIRGFRQDVASGDGLVLVEWHTSVRGAIRGLEKSVYAGADYRLGAIVAGVLLHALVGVLPFAGALLLGRGAPRAACLGNVALIHAMYRRSGSEAPLLHTALHPLGIALFAYAALRSAYRAIRTGGIEWRGTRYPLDELRRNVL
ncbi:glycosyltransferase [Rubrobacter marinus]|uniref:Glycosyltransferase n=1 Tax=Rubrobacter marinus TaxID=2653852 RepID=A0A6G8PYC2_9ACTN|nr:glycosyltransferase [Rubrobacter marinus]QIN79158.1 glycosyltransferase [Rubrobacter marinus]